MLRNDHRLMIQQYFNGIDHWTMIKLIDLQEGWNESAKYVTGTWKHTSDSYNNKQIMFTHDHPRHLHFTWIGGAWGGVLNIGSKMGRGSHRADETEIITNYIRLYNIQRMANGEFKVGGVLGSGVGDLRYNANSDFNAGDISWTIHY